MQRRIARAALLAPMLLLLHGCGPQEAAPKDAVPVPAAPAQPQRSPNAAAAVVPSEEFTRLAKDIGCFACHAINKKLLGPAWRNVAVVNRNDPGAKSRLMAKIAKGGSGVWGSIDMPGYPALSDETRRILVEYILSLE